jgi:transglycosylase-like protein with SLT domain
MRLARAFGTVAVVLVGGVLAAPPAAALETASSLRQAICHMVDGAAEANRLPAAFLTRILWQESRFRTDVISPAGAQGVAQFMPQTAAERGLADPYDPGPAIAQAARLLTELGARFGNLGLAAAAYNAGPARVAKFLSAQSDLPEETRLYVLAVTGRPVEDWAAPRAGQPVIIGAGQEPCLSVTADLAGWAPAQATLTRRALAAWQVRLDTYLARSVAYRPQPPGTAPVSERNRAAAVMCDRIRAMGMPCAVFQH